MPPEGRATLHLEPSTPSCPAFDSRSHRMSPCGVCPQATSRRSSQERKTLNLWPHSSATAARPRPGETWVPSAEVREERAPPSPRGTSVPAVGVPQPGGGWEGQPRLHRPSGSTRWQHSPASFRGTRPACGVAGLRSLLPGVLPSCGGESVWGSLGSCPHHGSSKVGTCCRLPLLWLRGIRLSPLRAPGPIPKNAPPNITRRSGKAAVRGGV